MLVGHGEAANQAIVQVVVKGKAAGLVERDGQALTAPQGSFTDAVVGLVLVVRAKGDEPQYVIVIGNDQRVAAFGYHIGSVQSAAGNVDLIMCAPQFARGRSGRMAGK